MPSENKNKRNIQSKNELWKCMQCDCNDIFCLSIISRIDYLFSLPSLPIKMLR